MKIPFKWKATAFVRALGFFKIPMLGFCRPIVEKLTDDECEVRIPLSRKTKNHLGSMYFGVLAVGADTAGGMLGMKEIRESGKKVSLVFKDFKAEFHKRPDADVHFICKDGKMVKEQVAETIRTGERVNRTLTIIATTPSLSGDEPVASFLLTLSLKVRADEGKKAV